MNIINLWNSTWRVNKFLKCSSISVSILRGLEILQTSWELKIFQTSPKPEIQYFHKHGLHSFLLTTSNT